VNYKEQRHRNGKNHGTSFQETRKGQKQDEWVKTKKVLVVIIREDVIAGTAEEKERLIQNDSVLGHWGHITR